MQVLNEERINTVKVKSAYPGIETEKSEIISQLSATRWVEQVEVFEQLPRA